MAKTKISELDAAAANNTDINSVDVSEGCAPSGINNAIREMGAMLKRMDNGTDHLTNPNITGDLDVDNININGNTISSTDTNGNVTVDPNGSGQINLSANVDVTGNATITTADNSTQLTLKSTDADASIGPRLDLIRDSGSPADGDALGRVRFLYDNDAGQETEAIRITGIATDVSDGTEDATLQINTMVGGTVRERITVGPSETIFNEDSVDLDFRVESNGNANMLFVDAGNDRVGIGVSSPSAKAHIRTASSSSPVSPAGDELFVEGSGDAGITIGAGNTSKASLFFADSGDSARGRIRYDHSEDSMEFAANGQQEHMRIDSSGNLLVGTTGHFNYSGDTTEITVGSAGTGTNHGGAVTFVSNNGGTTLGYVGFQEASGQIATMGSRHLTLGTNNTERMRIDSSGNLLVGRTSSSGFTTSSGSAHFPNGSVFTTVDGGQALNVSRLTSDGSIAGFYKDGTSVGSIGVNASRVYMAGPSRGIKFGNSSMNPVTASGQGADNSVDLGDSNIRFKDLYLSNRLKLSAGGGIEFGQATTSASGASASSTLLDSYETGTWTPTDVAGMNGFSTPNTSHYTKVGRAVFLRGTFSMTGVTTNVQVGGLPFTPFGNTFFSVIHQGFGVTINYANVQSSSARVSFNVAATGGGSQNINFTAYYFAS